MAVAVDDEPPISCEAHHDTWENGYKYKTEEKSQHDYNTDASYQECFDNGHNVYHKNHEKEFDLGQVDEKRANYMEATRTYGAWEGTASMEVIIVLNARAPIHEIHYTKRKIMNGV